LKVVKFSTLVSNLKEPRLVIREGSCFREVSTNVRFAWCVEHIQALGIHITYLNFTRHNMMYKFAMTASCVCTSHPHVPKYLGIRRCIPMYPRMWVSGDSSPRSHVLGYLGMHPHMAHAPKYLGVWRCIPIHPIDWIWRCIPTGSRAAQGRPEVR
jgi:hypothetical protein